MRALPQTPTPGPTGGPSLPSPNFSTSRKILRAHMVIVIVFITHVVAQLHVER